MAPATEEGRRVALVTGGSRGLGRSMVHALAARGLDVALTYRERGDLAEKVRDEAAALGDGRQLIAQFDQAADDAGDVVKTILDEWGRLDSLVLNAGMWQGGRITEFSPEDWWNVIEINLGGVYRAARAAVPALNESPNGSVTLISSVIGLAGFPGDTAYASSKAALVGFGKSLARELASSGTRVNVLAPGFVESDATANVTEKNRERLLQRSIIRRFGSAEEVAKGVVYLSEDATYTTGTVLTVDGGYCA